MSATLLERRTCDPTIPKHMGPIHLLPTSFGVYFALLYGCHATWRLALVRQACTSSQFTDIYTPQNLVLLHFVIYLKLVYENYIIMLLQTLNIFLVIWKSSLVWWKTKSGSATRFRFSKRIKVSNLVKYQLWCLVGFSKTPIGFGERWWRELGFAFLLGHNVSTTWGQTNRGSKI